MRPLLTILNYSAGVQSEWMLWMVLLGIAERPRGLVVVNADPGMENSASYRHAAAMRERCKDAGIRFVDADGPNLYNDLLNLKQTDKIRFDTPPFWTEPGDGTREGRLLQGCTRTYKIAPMDRVVRKELWRQWGIGRNNSNWLAKGSVEHWIGFTADEDDRVKGAMASDRQRFKALRFPLYERGLTKSDVVAEFRSRGLAIPERSMCNGCPYHGLRSLKEMHDNRQGDWQQAVNVDEAARDLSQIGVNRPCYVSKTLLPLTVLAEMNFELADPVKNDLHSCTSGVCFV